MKIAYFSDTYIPQVNGVTYVVDGHARLLAEKNDVKIYAPAYKLSGSIEKIDKLNLIIERYPSMPVMFYNDIDPELVQKESVLWKEKMQNSLFLDQVGEYSLENWTFRNLSFPEDFRMAGSVLIGNAEDFVIHGALIERLKNEGAIESEKDINYPDGNLAMKIIKLSEKK